MTAVCLDAERAFRGVDLTLALTYTPPEGEDRAGLAISASLFGVGSRKIEATSLTFDPATGEIVAQWDEATTQSLVVNGTYEARFVRSRGGQTRVFYVGKVIVQ